MTTKDDLKRLFHSHYSAMYHIAILILHDDISRDIVHDVFEALLKSERSDISASYLLTAIRNRCLKHIHSLTLLDRINKVYSVNENHIEDEAWPDDETLALIQSSVSNDLNDPCRRVVNLWFEAIMNKIASFCGCKVVFNGDSTKSFRLYFRWNQSDSFEEVVERLNNFEQIKLTVNDKTIKIECR